MNEAVTKYTPEYLIELLQKNAFKIVKPKEDYKFVIYCRKSTEDEGKQETSILQQREACLNHCDNIGIKKSQIVEIIEEEKSAKEPGKRKKFRQMLDDLYLHKYDGVIAWHPNRLARNMKEAGEIVDMLDKGVIKSLHFASFTFTNDNAGKMLLGITFVMSKQYSDALSDDVTRANRSKTNQGLYLGKVKPGYFKNSMNRLEPDYPYFNYMQNAWKMRLEGIAVPEIAKFLVQKRFKTAWRDKNTREKKHKAIKITPQWLDPYFKDPVYAGVLDFGSTYSDITKIYEFKPMVTIEEFLRINKKIENIQSATARRGKRSSNKYPHIFQNMLICSHCGNYLHRSITKRPEKLYYLLRCDTDNCKYKGKSIRPQTVIKYIIELFKTWTVDEKKMKETFIREIRNVTEDKRKEFKSKIISLSNELTTYQEDKTTYAKLLSENDNDISLKEEYQKEYKTALKMIKVVEKDILDTQIALADLKKLENLYLKLLEKWKEIPTILQKSKTIEERDFYIKKVFSNFTITDLKPVSFQLNPPFTDFVTLEKSKMVRYFFSAGS